MHKIGQPVQFFKGDGSCAQAAIVVDAHPDESACLTAFCPDSHEWVFHAEVPAKGASEDGPHWQCLEEDHGDPA